MKIDMQTQRNSRSSAGKVVPRLEQTKRPDPGRPGSLTVLLQSRLRKLVDEIDAFDPDLAAELRQTSRARSTSLIHLTRAIRTAKSVLGRRHIAQVAGRDAEIIEHFRAFVAVVRRDYPKPLPPRTALHRRMQMPDV